MTHDVHRCTMTILKGWSWIRPRIGPWNITWHVERRMPSDARSLWGDPLDVSGFVCLSHGYPKWPYLIRKMVNYSRLLFMDFGQIERQQMVLGLRAEDSRLGKCFETRWLTMSPLRHYMVGWDWGKNPPKELSVFGTAANSRRGLKSWGEKGGLDMLRHRFIHLKSLREALWNIVEYSKHIENYK